jgi:uncharacterized protein YdhG (YjbR/CyaY superfamily)
VTTLFSSEEVSLSPKKATKQSASKAARTSTGKPAKKSTAKAVKQSAAGTARESSSRAAPTSRESDGFTAEERAAMKERARELKAESGRGGGKKANGEMPEPDRGMARRLHEIVKASAPQLAPKTWYGMPAYARDGKVVCFFQSAARFKARYATLGFNDEARLDEGSMWPTSFALKKLTSVEEARIRELVKRAVGGVRHPPDKSIR